MSSKPTLTRFVLWTILVVSLFGLLTGEKWYREEALLSRSAELLVNGRADQAVDLLGPLQDSRWHTSRASAGLAIARSLLSSVQHPALSFSASNELGSFPWMVILRSAFERGDFSAALRLTSLLRSVDLEPPAALTAAALIETGNDLEAIAPENFERTPTGLLETRVADHFRKNTETPPAIVVRDRDGRDLGTIVDQQLVLRDAAFAGIVPREPVELAVAGLRDHVGSIRLSIDSELSNAALSALRGYRGSIVLLDSHSGEILAAVSDRRTISRYGAASFSQLREPASIAKLITTSAALRAGLDPNAEIAKMACRGHELYSNELLYCPHIAGRLRGLDRAMAVSCNVAFANVGVKVGRSRMLDEYKRYGFGSQLGLSRAGEILQPVGDDRQLADLAIGLDAIELTPLHAALIAATIANDGKMPSPDLLIARDGLLGLHPRPTSNARERPVLSSAWTTELHSAMQAVATSGSARGLAPPTFPIAIKTGTASHPRHAFHVNYIGYGPLPSKRLSFCIRITDRPTSKKVRAVARVVSRRLFKNLAAISKERRWQEWSPPPEKSSTTIATLAP